MYINISTGKDKNAKSTVVGSGAIQARLSGLNRSGKGPYRFNYGPVMAGAKIIIGC